MTSDATYWMIQKPKDFQYTKIYNISNKKPLPVPLISKSQKTFKFLKTY